MLSALSVVDADEGKCKSRIRVSLLPESYRDNGIIIPVWFAVPGKIKHFIIVFGTNIMCAEHASNY